MKTNLIFWTAILTAGILLLGYIGAEASRRKEERERFRKFR